MCVTRCTVIGLLCSYSADVFSFLIISPLPDSFFFFFNDTATTEIYTLSLHDALPISSVCEGLPSTPGTSTRYSKCTDRSRLDRKSTRLNSSHSQISYAVFCLKKKKKNEQL